MVGSLWLGGKAQMSVAVEMQACAENSSRQESHSQDDCAY
jgi:hypothetical protein